VEVQETQAVSAAGAQTFCSSDKNSEVGRQRTAELSNPSTTPTGLIKGWEQRSNCLANIQRVTVTKIAN
jgi:hypothetical protein